MSKSLRKQARLKLRPSTWKTTRGSLTFAPYENPEIAVAGVSSPAATAAAKHSPAAREFQIALVQSGSKGPALHGLHAALRQTRWLLDRKGRRKHGMSKGVADRLRQGWRWQVHGYGRAGGGAVPSGDSARWWWMRTSACGIRTRSWGWRTAWCTTCWTSSAVGCTLEPGAGDSTTLVRKAEPAAGVPVRPREESWTPRVSARSSAQLKEPV